MILKELSEGATEEDLLNAEEQLKKSYWMSIFICLMRVFKRSLPMLRRH